MTRANRLFGKDPKVALLVVDLVDRLQSTPVHLLRDTAFFASLVGHIVRTAKPTNPDERALLVKLRALNRGFVMREEGLRIVQAELKNCREALPRKRKVRG
jgi:hypothetical protein